MVMVKSLRFFIDKYELQHFQNKNLVLTTKDFFFLKFLFVDDAFAVVLNRLVGKCMHKKKYICSGTSKNASFEHFSLGFPIYTHFTSPIRRYADIVTHRLLATSLQYRKHFRLKVPEISDIANICNGQELRAEKAADASFDLYLAHFVESHQPFIEEAVVYNVKKDCFDVVVFRTGRSLRVYANVRFCICEILLIYVRFCCRLLTKRGSGNLIKLLWKETLKRCGK